MMTKAQSMGMCATLATALFVAHATQAQAQSRHEAESVVQSLIEETVSYIEANKELAKTEPDTVFDGLQKLITETVDMERISRLVTSKHWRKATPAQRERFIADFSKLMLHNYGHLLLRYSGEKIDILRSNSLGRRGQEVQTSMIWEGNLVKVDYATARSKKTGNWMIYDVRVDGISLVSTFRSSMQRILSEKGFDGLIASLNRKTNLGGIQ